MTEPSIISYVVMFVFGWIFCNFKHCGLLDDAWAFISDPEVRNADKKPREEFFYFYKYCPCNNDLLFFSVSAFGQREADRIATRCYDEIVFNRRTLEKTFDPVSQRVSREESVRDGRTIRFK